MVGTNPRMSIEMRQITPNVIHSARSRAAALPHRTADASTETAVEVNVLSRTWPVDFRT